MNHYTELLIYLKTLFEKDPLVNVVTQGIQEKSALDKMTLFPLVNLEVSGGSFTNGSTIVLSVTITVTDQRDVNKEINVDRFWNNDNEVDNMNETLAILNRAWSDLYRDFTREGITASENPSLTPVYYKGKSILDGWEISFDVSMPNKTLSLCQYN